MDHEIARILELGGRILTLEAGTVIIHQGQEVELVWCLLEGRAKVETTEQNGRSLLLCISEAGAFLGDLELFREDREATCTVTTVTAVRLWQISRTQLQAHLARHAWLGMVLGKSLANKMAAWSRTSVMNLLLPLEARYAQYLAETCPDASWHPIGLEEHARRMGASTRQLQRVLRTLDLEGVIERKGRSLRILDREALDARPGLAT